MLAAIIAAIFAALAVAAAIAIVSIFVARHKNSYTSQTKTVRHIEAIRPESSGEGGSVGDVSVPTSSDRKPVSTPADRLRPRFVTISVFAAAVFGSLTAKLWSLQILSGSAYSSEADDNLYNTVETPAPRGYICDCAGVPLVKNRASLTVLADPDAADDQDVIQRLSAVLGIPRNVVRQRIQDSSTGAQNQRVVASDVRLRDVAFITEHSDAFPKVSLQTRTVREYPYGALAAHALGYIGTPSEEELANIPEGRHILATDEVGKSGMESSYDNFLAGDHGQRVVAVDANGNICDVISETQPVKGNNVHLCINGPVQYLADKALAELIAPEEGTIGTGTGTGGAVVAMDLRDGGVCVMSSFPTYSPEIFNGGITQDTWDLYNTPESHLPLMNRAVAGSYPAASTYKAFTGLAGLEYKFATDKTEWECEGSWDGFHSGDWQNCWEHSGHGMQDLHNGIVNSCDVVFYEIAKAFWDAGPNGTGKISETAMQDEIAKFNFGKITGIDLGGETEGRIPTPQWKAEHWRDVPSEGVWRGGDMTNMVIGQGDVLITPIQLVVAYGAIATGKLYKPHLLKEVCNDVGDVVVKHETEVVGEPDVNPKYLDYIRKALRGVATDNSKLADMFAEYGVEAACKTGTGEVAGKDDYAWFVCYAPYDDPKYVVATIIEEGGGGSAAAAPIGSMVLGSLLQSEAGELDPLMGRIMGSSGKSIAYSGTSGERTD